VTSVERQSGHRTRWVCHCADPPILLAIYDQTGRIEIKVGDRYYITYGGVQATCPRCGAQHILELPQQPAQPSSAQPAGKHDPPGA
jgi:hypothetical protein